MSGLVAQVHPSLNSLSSSERPILSQIFAELLRMQIKKQKHFLKEKRLISTLLQASRDLEVSWLPPALNKTKRLF